MQIFPFFHNLAILFFSQTVIFMINNGKRTELSPIRSVIAQAINKRESDLLIARMITDRVGRHDVLLPINQNYDKIWERN